MLVVPRCGGCPGHEDDLSAIPVGVRGQERDVLPFDRALCDGDQSIKPVGRHLWTLLSDEFVGAIEVDERNGHSTVLRLRMFCHQCLSQTHRNPADQVDVVGHLFEGHERVGRNGGCSSQQEPRALGRSDRCWPQRTRRLWTQHDFAGVRRSLHRHHHAGSRTGNEEFTVRRTNEEKIEEPAVDAHRHAQRNPLAQNSAPSDLTERPSHLDCGTTRTGLMRFAGEKEQQSVTTELEQPAPIRDSQVEQGHETVPDRRREFFCPYFPVLRQTLREFREA